MTPTQPFSQQFSNYFRSIKRNVFLGAGFCFVRNSGLQTSNVRKMGQFCKGFSENFVILKYFFICDHFQKSICSGDFIAAVSCTLQSSNFGQKGTPLHMFFWILSKVFGATISKDLHEKICEEFSRVLGCKLDSCVLV